MTLDAEQLLLHQIQAGDDAAWQELITRYEGRLLGYVEQRLRNRAASEDVVQETLIGFLTSLPNFDRRRSLENYLFSIAAHKLTDYLRRLGRRPTLPLSGSSDSSGDWSLPGKERPASVIARSAERRNLESGALQTALETILTRWQEKGEWTKIRCAELLFVLGKPNKEVAELLNMSEQAVANQKFDMIERLRTHLHRQQLDADVFPELSNL
ncbi:MAG: sigma-70 family RNA polymerase sigma factor [Pirellulales bacterium]|nr:sigma-70 family RNA polymerase sigma factor [Pirellulales bacterium]